MDALMHVDCSNYDKLQSYYVELDELEFSSGDASFSEFSMSTEGWMGRKVTALPLAAAAIVKVIYHLSMAILEGLKGCCSQDTHGKMYTFYVVRDLEEFLGRFLTLFSDKVGGYLVEESAYQKACYFLASNKIEALSSLELQRYLKFLPPEVLAGISGPQLQGLDLSRLEFCDFQDMFPIDLDGQFTEETKAHFANLSAAQIQPRLQSLIRADLLKLISVQQLQGLDLSRLDFWDFRNMFPRDSDGHFTGETKAHFANLSAAQIQPCLQSLIRADLLKLISGKQLQGLDLSSLDFCDFQDMFPRDSDGQFTEETKARFAYLSAAQIQPFLQSLIGRGFFEILSVEQLQGLDLSGLNSWNFNCMFPRDFYSQFTEETKARFANLSAAQIQPILGALVDESLLKLISDEQLSGLDLSALGSSSLQVLFSRERNGDFSEETKARFAYLSAAQIEPILGRLVEASLKELISKKQIQKLEWDRISQGDLFAVFSVRKPTEESKNFFRFIESKETQWKIVQRIQKSDTSLREPFLEIAKSLK